MRSGYREIVLGAAFVLLLTLVLAACGSEENAAVPPTPPPAPVETRVGTHGVTVALPEGWQTMTTNHDQYSDPVTQVAVSSGPMRDRETCSQIADYGPEDDAVSLVIVEWQPSEDLELEPRPCASLGRSCPSTLASRNASRDPAARCLSPTGAASSAPTSSSAPTRPPHWPIKHVRCCRRCASTLLARRAW